jgi:hypothetical protein
LQAITSWDGEQCLLNEVSEKSFMTQQDSLAQCIKGRRALFRIPSAVTSFESSSSWTKVVHSLQPGEYTDRRDDPRDGHPVSRHASGMQWVASTLSVAAQ